MRRVLLVANVEKPNARELAEQAAEWLGSRVEVLGPDTSIDGDLSGHEADLVVVFGGDGTVLNAIRRLGRQQPPLLTVNLGRLGYLAEVSPDELRPTLARVLDGRFRISERMLLHGHVEKDGESLWHGHAVNEFVFSPSQRGRLSELELEVDGRPLTRLIGDGLIAATPTGSTAYAMSAGGPILSPELQAMVLVPICPHHLGNRPLVLDREETLSVRHVGRGDLHLIADGAGCTCADAEDVIKVRCSDLTFRLILGEALGRYDVLRAKLGWGS